MVVRARTRRMAPVVGGVTAVATAAGGMAAVSHAAPAAAEPSSATQDAPAIGAQTGTFESCSAYFGYGKGEAVLGLVQFDVADVEGPDDGVDHAVPDDVEVVLVIENDEGDTLECTPFELTEEMWDDASDDFPSLPFPGPGRYAYPSVNYPTQIEDFGDVTAVGYRVVTVPDDHTLVSPEGVQELTEFFFNPEALFFGDVVDARVLDLIEAEAENGAAARAAFAAALDCPTGHDPTDPDLIAAAEVLIDLIGSDDEPEAVICWYARDLHEQGSLHLGLIETADYVEPIELAAPEAPVTPTTAPTTTTTTTPAPTPAPTPTPGRAPAAQPVTASPTFTG